MSEHIASKTYGAVLALRHVANNFKSNGRKEVPVDALEAIADRLEKGIDWGQLLKEDVEVRRWGNPDGQACD